MSISKTLTLAAALILAMLAPSCVIQEPASNYPGEVVAAPSYNKFSGSLTARLATTMFEADKAVVASAKKLQLIPLSRRNQQQEIVYEYKNIYEDRIDVTLKEGKKGLELAIKMGKRGDRSFSRKLLKEIAGRVPLLDEPQPADDDEADAQADED